MNQRDAAITVPVPQSMAPGPWLLRYAHSYPGQSDQVREVRAFLRKVLVGRPRADDAVAVGSELAANACVHSRSKEPGGVFTVRAEVSEGDYIYVAVEDDGGQWAPRSCEVVPAHGLDFVRAIAGSGYWGIDGNSSGRVVWARLCWPGTDHLTARPVDAEETSEWTDDDVAELGRRAGQLAEALADLSLCADITRRAGRPPYVTVHTPETPALTRRVYAQAKWFQWETSERIAAADDVDTAAAAIAQRLQDCDGPAGA